jgi:hypothetical protein
MLGLELGLHETTGGILVLIAASSFWDQVEGSLGLAAYAV